MNAMQPSHSLLRLSLIAFLLAIVSLGLGWLLVTRVVPINMGGLITNPLTNNDEVTPSPTPSAFTNSRLHFSIQVPVGWTIQAAGHDPTKVVGAEAAQIVELFDPYVGLDQTLVTFTSIRQIPPADLPKLVAATYNQLPAQYFETTSPFKTQEKVYYLLDSRSSYVRIFVRSNSQPEVEQALQEIESSFTLIEY